MGCTTILVGKKASYDGSTIIARNDDSGAGSFTPKKFVVVKPEDQPRTYESVLSHCKVELPENPLQYTCVPNAVKGKGIWAANGVNSENVAMTATETITSNALVLGADPLVRYREKTDTEVEVPGGLGEEDFVVLVLPYIRSAREGVLRMAELLKTYGTYEMNGMAFSDVNEIWWLETIGGHHFIAKRVPDDRYVMMPNQFGIDTFDLRDAFGAQKEHICSPDLKEFIRDHFLDPSMDGVFRPRAVFGSHDDSDHVYNTPRAWYIGKTFNPSRGFEGPDAKYQPESDDIPWSMVPEKKLTVEDVKYVLSSHFQGTPYDPYGSYGDNALRGKYRSIGINRNDFLGMVQLRPYADKSHCAVQWLAFASNAFNVMLPFYAAVDETPAYLNNTTEDASTENFYWSSRFVAALADSAYGKCLNHVERYEKAVEAESHRLLREEDQRIAEAADKKAAAASANERISAMGRQETQKVLNKLLFEVSNQMKNAYARSDA